MYILDGDIFGVSPILENEFYKCIGINIDLRWVLSLMVSCRFKILFEKLPDRLCVIICGFTYIVGCVFRTYLEIDTTAGVFLFRLLSIGLPFYYYGMRIKKNNEENNQFLL